MKSILPRFRGSLNGRASVSTKAGQEAEPIG
jgi:hypothetical protein